MRSPRSSRPQSRTRGRPRSRRSTAPRLHTRKMHANCMASSGRHSGSHPASRNRYQRVNATGPETTSPAGHSGCVRLIGSQNPRFLSQHLNMSEFCLKIRCLRQKVPLTWKSDTSTWDDRANETAVALLLETGRSLQALPYYLLRLIRSRDEQSCIWCPV